MQTLQVDIALIGGGIAGLWLLACARRAGYNAVFAPDGDITIGAADPIIGSRSAGTKPTIVAQAVVAAIRQGLVTGPVTVSLPGGDLMIDWRAGGHIQMTGPATFVFSGETDWERF